MPWQDQVAIVDGTSCGFPSPARRYQPHPETVPTVRNVGAAVASNGHEPIAPAAARA